MARHEQGIGVHLEQQIGSPDVEVQEISREDLQELSRRSIDNLEAVQVAQSTPSSQSGRVEVRTKHADAFKYASTHFPKITIPSLWTCGAN